MDPRSNKTDEETRGFTECSGSDCKSSSSSSSRSNFNDVSGDISRNRSQINNNNNNMIILFPLIRRVEELEAFYPRRLVLGLWRVYGQFAVKMMRFQLGKCKSPLPERSDWVSNQVRGPKCDEFCSSCSSRECRSLKENSLRKSGRRSPALCNCRQVVVSSTNSSTPSSLPSGPVNVNHTSSCQKSSTQVLVTSDSPNYTWNKSKNLPSPRNSSRSASSSSTSTSSPIKSNTPSCHFVKFSMGSWTFLVLFFLLLLLGSTAGCGPGRGAGRRRAPRKLTPLVYKQHVPNVPENTLSASGLNEGRITRDHQRFKNLVPNYNQDIIFRDDEGSGADRLMTQRCKEKLNTLAISVMNQWPGVKLRVIEGWDEETLHAPHSLHYEGRAVDITTSDKDRSKYGMLARLAVEAGFDWVYYESRAHIHCSVKSDSTQAGRTGGCFNGNSTVETPTGSKKISEIQTGDQILGLDSYGNEVFSDVLLFLDRNVSETREFFVIRTGSGTSLTLTPSHLLYTVQPESLTPDESYLFSPNSYILDNQTGGMFLDKAVISFARGVQIGDWILVRKNSSSSQFHRNDSSALFTIEKVIDMEVLVDTGVYAPLTSTGNLLVDGVLSSCYAVIDDQDLAHSAFLPLRLSHNFVKGVTYFWKQLSRFISFRHSENPEEKAKESNEINYGGGDHSGPSSRNTESEEQGVHWYARGLYSFSKFVLPDHLHYDE